MSGGMGSEVKTLLRSGKSLWTGDKDGGPQSLFYPQLQKEDRGLVTRTQIRNSPLGKIDFLLKKDDSGCLFPPYREGEMITVPAPMMGLKRHLYPSKEYSTSIWGVEAWRKAIRIRKEVMQLEREGAVR